MWQAAAVALPFVAAWWACRRRHHDEHIVTVFANHKGGVGKSTLAFLAARRYAESNPEERVLLVDCSVYKDVSRMFGGGDANSVQRALERRCCGAAPGMAASDRLPNFHLLSSDGRRAVPEKGDLRKLLPRGEAWVVFVDTDGGDVTPLTRLALRAADNVVVPTHSNDVRRIERTVQTTEELGLSFHGRVVFNRVRVKKLEEEGFEPHDSEQIDGAQQALYKRLGEHTYVSDIMVRDACKFAARLYDEPFARMPDGLAGDVDRLFY